MGAMWRVLSIALAVVALAGCGDSDEDSSGSQRAAGTFVGKLTGSDAYVAVVAGKENVVAYVCDGEHEIGQLFVGRRSGATFESRAGGARIDVELSEDRASGRVTLTGAGPRRFSAGPARGEAGFYRKTVRREGRELRLGWVVLGDGSQRGASTDASAVTTAPSLRPSSATFTLARRTLSAVRVSATGVDEASGFGGGFQGFGG